MPCPSLALSADPIAMRRVRFPAMPIIPAILADISPAILEWCDADDLVRARGVNSTWDVAVAATLYCRVRDLVSPAIADYDAFVEAMEDCGAVIGGIGALRVLFPRAGSPPFLELFAPIYSFPNLVDHLLRHEQFDYAPATTDDADLAAAVVRLSEDNFDPTVEVPSRVGRRGVAAVSRLRKGNFTIWVIQSTVDSPLYPLTGEWNTALFNYVGARRFSSAYPHLTRARRALLNPAVLDDAGQVPAWLALADFVWRDVGWAVSADWLPWSPGGRCAGVMSAGCASASRYFGDGKSVWGSMRHVRATKRWRRDLEEEVETAYWWRGGRTCTAACHTGVVSLQPGARVCNKRLLRDL